MPISNWGQLLSAYREHTIRFALKDQSFVVELSGFAE
jgi:hypothetical protein